METIDLGGSMGDVCRALECRLCQKNPPVVRNARAFELGGSLLIQMTVFAIGGSIPAGSIAKKNTLLSLGPGRGTSTARISFGPGRGKGWRQILPL